MAASTGQGAGWALQGDPFDLAFGFEVRCGSGITDHAGQARQGAGTDEDERARIATQIVDQVDEVFLVQQACAHLHAAGVDAEIAGNALELGLWRYFVFELWQAAAFADGADLFRPLEPLFLADDPACAQVGKDRVLALDFLFFVAHAFQASVDLVTFGLGGLVLALGSAQRFARKVGAACSHGKHGKSVPVGSARTAS